MDHNINRFYMTAVVLFEHIQNPSNHVGLCLCLCLKHIQRLSFAILDKRLHYPVIKYISNFLFYLGINTLNIVLALLD